MNFKKKSLSFIASVVVSTKLMACGFYMSPFDISYYEYNHINKDLINSNKKLYLNQNQSRFTLFWDRCDNNDKILKELNIKEWVEYFKNKYSTNDVLNWIYSKNKSKIEDREADEYMRFAKKQEPFAQNTSDDKENNFNQVKPFVDEAILKYKTVKSDFIKLRYAFLMIRLAHYYGNSLLALNLYETYAKPLNLTSITNEWIDALVAGANRKLGKYPLAAYQFAKVFANNKTNNHIGLYDFKITDQKQWNELMELCKNGEEKALMYTMRALKQNADGIMELENIYDVNPNSQWFDLVLYREFFQIEFNYFNVINDKTKIKVSQYEIEEAKQSSKSTKLKIDRLKKILSKIVSDNKMENAFFSKSILVMLNFFANNSQETLQELTQLEKIADNQIKKEQIKYLKSLIDLVNLEKIDENIENVIAINYENIDKIYKKSYENILKRVLYNLYDDKNRAKKHLLENDFSINLETINIETLLEIAKLDKKQNKNAYEQLLVSNYQKNNENVDKNYDESYILGVLNLRSFKFKEAKINFSKSKYKNEKLQYNPFNAFISGNNRVSSKSKITIEKFVTTLVEIDEKLKKDANNSMDNYLLANAYYNMSWFGNSPMSIRFSRSTTTWSGDLFYSMDKAKYHYIKALENTIDKELKSKIVYMLSKCELNENIVKNKVEYFDNAYDIVNSENNELLNKLKNGGFGKYFDMLQNEYKDSKYYLEILKECGTFKKYIGLYNKTNERERR